MRCGGCDSGCVWQYGAANEDHLINIGTCAGEAGTDEMSGKAYLCHKLTDRNTGHTYYPDMLYRHAFAEAQLITEPIVWKGTEDSEALRRKAESAIVLHDMEGAAIYQAGSYWLGPHQMSFIKVVSDHGTDQRITSQTLEQAVENGLDAIKDYVSNIGQIIAQNRRDKEWETECSRQTERLCEELHCSQTMRLAVIQCVRYWTLAGVDHNSLLEQMRADGELPCRDRREGKKRFDELKQRLL